MAEAGDPIDFKSVFGHFAIAVLLMSLTGCESCGYAECIGTGEHSFEQKVLFQPEHLQYHIGDTIWISSKFDCHNMVNAVTGLPEDYCGLKSIGASFQIHDLTRHYPADSIKFDYVPGNFDFVHEEGNTQTANDYASDINFQIKDDQYSFKFAIIPKVMGKYAMYVSDSGPVKLPGSERCDTGGFGLTNGNEDNHSDLFKEYNGGSLSDFEQVHIYCFEVIQ